MLLIIPIQTKYQSGRFTLGFWTDFIRMYKSCGFDGANALTKRNSDVLFKHYVFVYIMYMNVFSLV